MDFRRGGKYRKENGVEKWVFLCLAMGGKQEGWKTQEKNFSPGPTNFFLPNQEEKQGEKTVSVQFYCNTPFWNQAKKKNRERERWSKKKGKNESGLK